MTPIMKLALRATRQVNEYIIQNVDKRDPVSSDSGADQNLTDHLEETLFQVLFDNLKKGYPGHFLAKPGERAPLDKEDSWELIGFQSNMNTLCRRLPGMTYSIIHRHHGKVQSCIVANPFTGDEYTAVRGGGAALNNRRIRCTSVRSLQDAQIATNTLAYITASNPASHFVADLTSEISSNVQRVSISGNPVLDAVMVASGQVDAAVLLDTDQHELAGALLICQEAGTLSGRLNGSLLPSDSKANTVIANPKLYKAIVQRFGGYETKTSDT